MRVLTINNKACYGPGCCEVFICEHTFPGIHECMAKKGFFMVSDSMLNKKKSEIENMIGECPAGAINLCE